MLKKQYKLATLGLERYVLTTEEGLLIAAIRVDADYEQHLKIMDSVKQLEKGEEKRKVIC